MLIRKILIYVALMVVMLSSYAATTFSPDSGIYVINDITVHDEQTYAQYRQKVAPIIESFGGTYVVRAGAIFVSDNPTSELLRSSGDWNPDRMIVLHFDSIEQLGKFANSPEYKEIVHLRTSAASTKSVVVNAYQPDK